MSIRDADGAAELDQASIRTLRAQRCYMRTIETILNDYTAHISTKTNVDDIEVDQEILEHTWTDFKSGHEKLCDSTDLDLVNNEYFTDSIHETVHGLYLEAKRAVFKHLKKMQAESRNGSSSRTSSHLPSIPIPIFDGKYAKWKGFSNLFTSLVGDVDDKIIPRVEKLARLKAALTGDAAALIANPDQSNENFDVAWNCLVKRYENKRLLVNAHVGRIFALKPVQQWTSAALMTIINTIKESLDALKALQAPTEHWDILISFMIRRLLDPATKVAWEVQLGSSTETPPLKYFMDFLTAQARAMENVEQEDTKPSQPPSSNQTGQRKSARAHHGKGGAGSSQKSPSNQSEIKCICCGDGHHLGAACSKFMGLGPVGRRDYVRDNKLCYNCLGRHNANECGNEGRCRMCKGKHHTLIHRHSPGDTENNGTKQQTSNHGDSSKEESPGGSGNTGQINFINGSGGGSSGSRVCGGGGSSKSCTSVAALQSLAGHTAGRTSVAVLQGQASLTAGQSSSSVVGQGRAGLTAGHSPSSSSVVHQSLADHTASSHHSSESRQLVLLATAQAIAISESGFHQAARILIDQGSELSFISEYLVDRLHLHRMASDILIIGIGDTESVSTRGVVSVKLQSLFNNQQQVTINAHIMSKLTARLPSFPCKATSIDHLKALQLADRNFLKPGSIQIIIGADYYGQIIGNEIIKSKDNQLVAQRTIFGWVVSGTVCCSSCSPKHSLTAVRKSPAEQLLDLLKRFWIQEEPPRTTWSELDPDELECELHFQKTHSRDESGRYVVRLPLKSSPAALGDTKQTAIRMLQRITRRFSSDPEFKSLYSNFLKEYEALNHLRRVHETSEPTTVNYLSHHGVKRIDSVTTPLRVVFNGSGRSSTGVSLNDILYPGAKLQVDNVEVLLRLRSHRLVFGTDVKQMFRQRKVHPDDRDLQRILWVDEDQRPVPYQLTTVTYGLNCAPWLALRALQQLVEDDGHRYPLAVPALSKGRYVDDIYGGADSEQDLKLIIEQLQGLCMAGGFPLQKWSSNCPLVLQDIGLITDTSLIVQFEEAEIKVLGLCWHPSSDTFRYKSKAFSSSVFTKRSVLSEIAQIYDPLGIITPVIIRAKIMIQELWLLKIGSDDRLPPHYIRRWREFREELNSMSSLSVPRWLNLSSAAVSIQLHGFADGSTTAMGAVVYLRVEERGSDPIITLVCAKSRVAPIKQVSVPRLELMAVVLLSDLVEYVQKKLEIETLQLYLWTDYTVALAWVTGHPSRWKDFVRNRVAEIQETLPNGIWHHISGTENPADCVSRGISPTELAEHPLRWHIYVKSTGSSAAEFQ